MEPVPPSIANKLRVIPPAPPAPPSSLLSRIDAFLSSVAAAPAPPAAEPPAAGLEPAAAGGMVEEGADEDEEVEEIVDGEVNVGDYISMDLYVDKTLGEMVKGEGDEGEAGAAGEKLLIEVLEDGKK
mmetsp:Transcript_472/g.1439  ORF Transcript_472/g.1439 Transcript_472/m.1439 type:complete len:127 (+) Transcript_472:50-430(+)